MEEGKFGTGEGFWKDPVVFDKKLNGWIFWDETWASYQGPFDTEAICRQKLQEYCDWLTGMDS